MGVINVKYRLKVINFMYKCIEIVKKLIAKEHRKLISNYSINLKYIGSFHSVRLGKTLKYLESNADIDWLKFPWAQYFSIFQLRNIVFRVNTNKYIVDEASIFDTLPVYNNAINTVFGELYWRDLCRDDIKFRQLSNRDQSFIVFLAKVKNMVEDDTFPE